MILDLHHKTEGKKTYRLHISYSKSPPIQITTIKQALDHTNLPEKIV